MRRKKSLDNEIDLVAFISLLSVCICFLLLTAVWIQIGSMNVKQAVGGQAEEGKKNPALWTLVQSDGSLSLRLEDAPKKVSRKFARMRVEAIDGKPNFEQLRTQVAELKKVLPALTTALIQPKKATAYEDIIGMMDLFKQEGLSDLGVAPL